MQELKVEEAESDEPGFKFVVEYRLNNDGFTAELLTDNIEELRDLCHKAQERFFVKCQNRVKII